MTSRTPVGLRALLGVLLALTAVGAVACVDRETREETGAGLFAAHCAACHGITGAGDGPVAAMLTVPPADLRKLAARSGGRFDEAAVLAFIDGREQVAAHGPRDMPVWGRLFLLRHEGEPMPVYAAMGDARAVVDHLRTLQEP